MSRNWTGRKIPLSLHGAIYVQDTEDNEDNDDFNETEIDFKQWATADGTNLTLMKVSVSEFINLLCKKIDKITSNSYTARSQSNYLAYLKEKIGFNEAIISEDFAENYSFIIQDEIQG